MEPEEKKLIVSILSVIIGIMIIFIAINIFISVIERIEWEKQSTYYTYTALYHELTLIGGLIGLIYFALIGGSLITLGVLYTRISKTLELRKIAYKSIIVLGLMIIILPIFGNIIGYLRDVEREWTPSISSIFFGLMSSFFPMLIVGILLITHSIFKIKGFIQLSKREIIQETVELSDTQSRIDEFSNEIDILSTSALKHSKSLEYATEEIRIYTSIKKGKILFEVYKFDKDKKAWNHIQDFLVYLKDRKLIGSYLMGLINQFESRNKGNLHQ